MELLWSVSLRVLIPALVAFAVLGIGRVKAAAARHAVWTVVMAGMFLHLVLAPVLQPIPVRVLPAAAQARAPGAVLVETAPAIRANPAIPVVPAPATDRSWLSWRLALAAVYSAGVLISLLRLAFGYGLTRRLVGEARRIDDEVCESSWISVPMAVGWLHPKILLPPEWREWEEAKIEAVLAHERWHVRRADWAIAGAAAINRSFFWFHPLAWWLERTLAALAEQACDDAALLETADRTQYAQVLLEMAAAVRASRGRMVWDAMAMAKTAEVHVRIDRILDETRQIPLGPSRRWRGALLLCSLPLLYAAAVVHVAPVLAQEQPTKQGKMVAAPVSQVETPAHVSGPAPQLPATKRGAAATPMSTTGPTPAAHSSGTDPVPATQSPAADQAPTPKRLEFLAELTPVSRVAPEYPRLAQETGARGTVELIATVAPEGNVTGVKIVRGPPMLQKAAADAVIQWIYSPQTKETQTLAMVDFPGMQSPQPAGGQIQPAVLMRRKEPEYPQAAREAGAKGTVELVATIGTDGRVKAVKVLRGPAELQQAAADAVTQWIYKPTMLNGAPVESQTQVHMNFMGEAPAQQSLAPPAAIQQAALIFRKEPIAGGDLQNLGGTVVFQAQVGLDGRLSNIRVTDGPAELVPAALEAVKQWVYRPATMNGQPIETDTRIALLFKPSR